MASANNSQEKSPNKESCALYSRPSLQTLLEFNDIPDFANEPGPGHYFGPGSQCFSSLGKQKISGSKSSPEIGFAHTGWKEWENVLVTKGHAETMKGRVSPGPAYSSDGLSKKATVFGAPNLRPDQRQASEPASQLRSYLKEIGVDPNGSPGPQYDVRDKSCSKVWPEHKKDQGFGRSLRFPVRKTGNEDAPLGNQTDKALNPGTGKSFGSGRSAFDKVTRPGLEKDFLCREGPGIGPPLWTDYSKGSGGTSFARPKILPKDQSPAKKKSLAATEGRKKDPYETISPGPAAYRQLERSVSSSRQVISDTRTPSSCRFGDASKKPRCRLLLASNTSKRGSWGYF